VCFSVVGRQRQLGVGGGRLPLRRSSGTPVPEVGSGRRGWAWAYECPVGRSLKTNPRSGQLCWASGDHLTLPGGPESARPLASARSSPPATTSRHPSLGPSLRFANSSTWVFRLGPGPQQRLIGGPLARLPVGPGMTRLAARAAGSGWRGSASPSTKPGKVQSRNSRGFLAPEGGPAVSCGRARVPDRTPLLLVRVGRRGKKLNAETVRPPPRCR